MDAGAWTVLPRLPLGDAYSGECRARETACQPDQATLLQFCSMGYGRGCCPRFPSDAGVDAVRFHIASQRGDIVQIQYIFERDGWPKQHAIFECSVASHEPPPALPDDVLSRQAAAFVESFRRRSAP
jgi:hypothetical protein